MSGGWGVLISGGVDYKHVCNKLDGTIPDLKST